MQNASSHTHTLVFSSIGEELINLLLDGHTKVSRVILPGIIHKRSIVLQYNCMHSALSVASKPHSLRCLLIAYEPTLAKGASGTLPKPTPGPTVQSRAESYAGGIHFGPPPVHLQLFLAVLTAAMVERGSERFLFIHYSLLRLRSGRK